MPRWPAALVVRRTTGAARQFTKALPPVCADTADVPGSLTRGCAPAFGKAGMPDSRALGSRDGNALARRRRSSRAKPRLYRVPLMRSSASVSSAEARYRGTWPRSRICVLRR